METPGGVVGCLSQSNGATSLAWGAKVAMAAKQMLGGQTIWFVRSLSKPLEVE